MYQRYAISVAQALFPFREISQYWANRARRHSADPIAATDSRAPSACYVCSIPHAHISDSIEQSGSLAPNVHGLRPGVARGEIIPISHGDSPMNISHSEAHHSAAEYVGPIISYIGRMEAQMASFVARKTASFQLENGAHGCQCASCGGAPLAVRPPRTSLTVRLPMCCDVPDSVSELPAQDNVPQGPLGGKYFGLPCDGAQFCYMRRRAGSSR